MYKTLHLNPRYMTRQVQDILRAIGGWGFIGGGYARYLFNNQRHIWTNDRVEPTDIDIFHCSPNHDLLPDLEAIGYERGGKLPNATNLYFKTPGKPVQVVDAHENEYICMVGPVAHVLDNFDYTCNMFGVQWNPASDTFVCTYTDQAVEDARIRRLRINHVNCPVALAGRAVKYGKKGFSMGLGDLARLFLEWEDRPFLYRRHIRDLIQRGVLGEATNDELYALLRID